MNAHGRRAALPVISPKVLPRRVGDFVKLEEWNVTAMKTHAVTKLGVTQ